MDKNDIITLMVSAAIALREKRERYIKSLQIFQAFGDFTICTAFPPDLSAVKHGM